MKAVKRSVEKTQEQVHSVRITLSSKNVKNLEKVCAGLVSGAKNKRLKVKEDDGMPTKFLHIANRNSPCGEGMENSQFQDERTNKKGPTNFRWTPSMSRFLIPFLAEQAKLGLKVNKTFKRPAFVAAARAVSEKFKVSCNDSNVENHMRTVKVKYAQIKKLQTLSGVTWDAIEKKIIMDEEAYNEHITAHSKDEPYLNKSIELYDEIVLICGDDQATGSSANDITKNIEGAIMTADNDVNIIMDEDIGIEEIGEETQSRSQQVSTSSDSTGRTIGSSKRSRHLGDKIDYLALQIAELAEAIRSSRKGISSELFSEIMKFEGYDEASLGKAFDYLHEHENLARAFLAKNHNLRQAWLSDFFSGGGRTS